MTKARHLTSPLIMLTRQLLAVGFFDNPTEDALKQCLAHILTPMPTGGMDRDVFAEAIFKSDADDLANLPVGHLIDHRVRLPVTVAERIAHEGAGVVAAALRKMLCASDHPQGALFVAEALGLVPERDADRLLAVYAMAPDFAVLCLAGCHGDAVRMLRTGAASASQDICGVLATTATYWAALELQLIAARQRAIGSFRFAVQTDQTDTVGTLADDVTALARGIDKATVGVFSDKKLPGAPHQLMALLRPELGDIEQEIADRHPGGTGAFLDALRVLYSRLDPVRKQALESVAVLDKHTEKAKGIKNREGARSRISTAFAGVTGGEQLAFASLRLIAFADAAMTNVHETVAGRRVGHQRWLGARLPSGGATDHRALKLLLVGRSVVWRSTDGAPPAFEEDGSHYDLALWIGADRAGDTGGLDLIDTIKKARGPEWIATRRRVDRHGQLDGPQLWDILADYRFEADQPEAGEQSTSQLRKKDLQQPRAWVQKEHQPSPQYRAPRKIVVKS